MEKREWRVVEERETGEDVVLKVGWKRFEVRGGSGERSPRWL